MWYRNIKLSFIAFYTLVRITNVDIIEKHFILHANPILEGYLKTAGVQFIEGETSHEPHFIRL